MKDLKLVSITFENAPRLPGIRPGDLSTLECEKPNTPMIGWRAIIRAGAIFLVSPRGWKSGRHPKEWNSDEPSVIHEIPRANCYLHWAGDSSDIESMLKTKFETPPFGPPIPPPDVEIPSRGGLLAGLDPKDMGDA
jgi:hypothetical protein